MAERNSEGKLLNQPGNTNQEKSLVTECRIRRISENVDFLNEYPDGYESSTTDKEFDLLPGYELNAEGHHFCPAGRIIDFFQNPGEYLRILVRAGGANILAPHLGIYCPNSESPTSDTDFLYFGYIDNLIPTDEEELFIYEIESAISKKSQDKLQVGQILYFKDEMEGCCIRRVGIQSEISVPNCRKESDRLEIEILNEFIMGSPVGSYNGSLEERCRFLNEFLISQYFSLEFHSFPSGSLSSSPGSCLEPSGSLSGSSQERSGINSPDDNELNSQIGNTQQGSQMGSYQAQIPFDEYPSYLPFRAETEGVITLNILSQLLTENPLQFCSVMNFQDLETLAFVIGYILANFKLTPKEKCDISPDSM